VSVGLTPTVGQSEAARCLVLQSSGISGIGFNGSVARVPDGLVIDAQVLWRPADGDPGKDQADRFRPEVAGVRVVGVLDD